MTLFFEQPELLVAFKRGETAALGAVYSRYHPLVRSTLTRFRGRVSLSEHDCRDLVATTFERAFNAKARSSYDGLWPYSAYLATIANNATRDWIRRHRRLVNLDFDESIHSNPESFVACDAQLDYQRAVDATRRWLETQPQSTRDYVAKRFIEGTSQRDMEKEAGISRRNARTQDAKAIDALKAYLDAQRIPWRKLFD